MKDSNLIPIWKRKLVNMIHLLVASVAFFPKLFSYSFFHVSSIIFLDIAVTKNILVQLF